MKSFAVPHFNISIFTKALVVLIFLIALSVSIGWSYPTAGEPNTPAVGEKAPDFSLNSLDGAPIKLSQELKKGPVVLIVLRGWPGYQCPYCTRQVGEFITRAKDIEANGASVLLVYPGPADKLKEHAEEFRGNKDIPKNFKLLIDPDYGFTNAYHLRWDAQGETAYPSTFVLDKSGNVKFALVSKTRGGRAKAEDVIKVLSTMDN